MFKPSASKNLRSNKNVPASQRKPGNFIRLGLIGLLFLCGTFTPLLSAKASAPADEDKSGELVADTLQVPSEFFQSVQAMSAEPVSAPGYYDTSVYMIGKVAVGIVLPESNGDGENWTDAEINQVVDKIQKGTDQWVGWGGVQANLSFVFDVHPRVPTTYEPIQLSSTQDYLWVNETLNSLGFNAGPDNSFFSMFERLYQYANHLRAQYQTQWAFVIYVVDSSADLDGKFTNGRFAYAYYFGPMMVMTYDNGNWSINNMNWVTAHEIGHIFGAADQYIGGCFGATYQFGYLGVVNSNCGGPIPSLMRDGAFYGPDTTTLGQVGWRDSDGDGIFDPVDTTLNFSLAPYAPNPTRDTNLTYTGSISDLPWRHAECIYCYTHDVSINAVTGVEFCINNGGWQPALAADGMFDSSYEIFTFNTGNIPEGEYTIEVRAINSSNLLTVWSDRVVVGEKSPFADVPAGYWAQKFIMALSANGITSGCGGGNYCPADPITRSQMAVFLLRAKRGSSYTPPAASGAAFNDVPSSHWAAAWIEQLAAEGITSGCGGGNYCPETPITRAQMAVFLLRAKHGSSYSPPPASGAVFSDVPASYWAAAWIEQLAAEGITSGCGGGNYCPETPVTRDQMAVFLQRVFDLPLP